MSRRQRPRRGILLLIVLSLLVLFVLIGVTFIVVADRHVRDAKIAARQNTTGDDPIKESDNALMRILRGPADTRSALYRHSLLGDLYGMREVPMKGAIVTATPPAANPFVDHFIEIRVNYAFNPPQFTLADVERLRYDMVGRVFSYLDRSGRVFSSRIVKFPAQNDLTRFYVHPFENDSRPLGGETFLINAKPFDGTGYGYNPTDNTLSHPGLTLGSGNSVPAALMPFNTFVLDANLPIDNSSVNDLDESWDAADYQNAFLARVPVTPSPRTNGADPLLPSFHQPYLINYWLRNTDLGADPATVWQSWMANPQLLRTLTARPLPMDHPLFTGSNPAFSADLWRVPPTQPPFNLPPSLDQTNDGLADIPLVSGPWDVDNDNDGIADSVWVDLGDRVKMAPDGRLYKPLYAVLCVDMDGRLNLNAHGSHYAALQVPLTDPSHFATTTGVLTDVLLGQGYGPAEIRLDFALPANVFQRIVPPIGGGAVPLPGRYGADNLPGVARRSSPLSFMHEWGIPEFFQTQAATYGSLCQTPLDPRGMRGVYLDFNGQPRFHYPNTDGTYMVAPNDSEWIDDPYESNLITPQADDALYTVNDLEQMLRLPDFEDYSNRLLIALNATQSPLMQTNLLRRFTTHSFDIPAPPAAVTGNADPRSLAQLVRQRLTTAGMTDVNQLNRQIQLIVPTELRYGQKMDLNRLLGNGKDDNSNGVVDDPIELLSNHEELMWNTTDIYGRFVDMDDPNFRDQYLDNTQTVPNVQFSRQVFARHLYCMAMFLLDNTFSVTGNASGNEETARRVAQWAVNVVDFRDPDSIMTPFEYDVNPFNLDGWSVDDNFATNDRAPSQDQITRNDAATPSPDRRIVWGMERPELLITESLAFHNKGLRDTDEDDRSDDDAEDQPLPGEQSTKRYPEGNRPNPQGLPVAQPDKDLDQFRVPQGSLFLELYATGNSTWNNPNVPAEIYSPVPGGSGANTHGVDLGRMIDGSPVWRVYFTRVPWDVNGNNNVNWTNNIERQALIEPVLPAALATANRTATYPNDEPVGINLPNWNGIPTPTVDPEFDRILLFTTQPPAPASRETVFQNYHYFYRRTGYYEPGGISPPPSGVAAVLEPGRYAVIGPRTHTVIGSQHELNDRDTLDRSDQELILNSQDLPIFQAGRQKFYHKIANPATIPNARPVEPLVLIAAADPPAVGGPNPWNNRDRTAPTGIGINISEPVPGPRYYQEPSTSAGPLATARLYPDSYYNSIPDVPFDIAPNLPLTRVTGQGQNGDAIPFQHLRQGTHPYFAVALLQRLADPTRGFNEITNPYITVDTQPLDLTVFNGDDDEQPDGWDQGQNPVSMEPFDVRPLQANTVNSNSLQDFRGRERGQQGNITDIIWDSQSHLGQNANLVAAADVVYVNRRPITTLGELNVTSYGPIQSTPAQYIGSPTTPFRWITWNNRPFANALELTMVPSSAPWRLVHEQIPAGNNVDVYSEFNAGYPYLMNFFFDQNGTAQSNLAGLFDFVTTPSPYVGTQRWLSRYFSDPANDLRAFRAPFNKAPLYREPGKVNLNTIPDDDVWQAVRGERNLGTSWADMQQSLSGASNANDPRPAYVSNPFRAGSSAKMMPPFSTRNRSVTDATLLRQEANGSDMLFDPPTGSSYSNTTTNPYFRYQRMMRLSNLTTTHSNVYAIWITTGYFEVLPWNNGVPDAVHPDGYQLGKEMGSDTGQTTRHRAFYIIDRSIPVAFEPGHNHNVDELILLRRHIE